jgi:hypothetical protein
MQRLSTFWRNRYQPTALVIPPRLGMLLENHEAFA